MGHWKVVALTRDPAAARAKLPASVEPVTLDAVKEHRARRYDAVVHLAGASIAGGLWTRRRKDILWRSRVDGTRDLVDALAALEVPPRVFVSASGMGYYGHRGDATVQLGDPPGAVLGSGTQFMPWIHIEDVAELFFMAATNAEISGPLHGVASDVVTQTEFSRTLSRVLRRPLLFRAPSFALRLALGEMADLFLHGQRALPHPPVGLRFAKLEDALRDAL